MARPDGELPHGSAGQVAGRPSSGVSLLDVEPELRSFLTKEELAEARRIALPVRTMKMGASAIELLQETDAFGAIVLEGLLLHGVQIGERPSLRLVEPSNVVPFTRSTPPLPGATVSLRAATLSRIVLLEGRFLLATRRWPQLAALIYGRALESSERLATQLAISHLSRVDERLMALMWLLADDWGHVTPAGIRLRLALTHEALGELIGAKRPTVTLALKELSERGSLIRQDQDWVILDPPPEPYAAELEPSVLLDAPRRRSGRAPQPGSEAREGRLTLLRSELARLREKYAPDRARAQELRDEANRLRARALELRGETEAFGDIGLEEPAASPSTVPPKT